ncbi:MAG: ABC transporter permease [Verrucomicrobiae bacterium]|nr:ABC transporter permease [Verrucomicrobiae bacterium]
MAHFIFRRFLTLIPLLLAISVLSFALLEMAPGDYLSVLKGNRELSPEYIDQLRKDFGLDKSYAEQFVIWFKKAIQFDFGPSFAYRMPVSELLAQRIPATLLLAFSSALFAWIIAIPLGVLAAIYQNSIFDRLASGLAFFSLSIPEFFLALLAIFFAAQTGWFPLGGLYSADFEFLSFSQKTIDILHHLVLPTFVLGIGSVASLMRLMRANFLEEIRANYVVTARAKGLPNSIVMFRHVLRNAINPLITILGYSIAGLLSGSLIVETIMSYPGLGQLVYESLLRKDLYVVMASILMASVLLVFGNLVSDLLLAICDPRIRLKR